MRDAGLHKTDTIDRTMWRNDTQSADPFSDFIYFSEFN